MAEIFPDHVSADRAVVELKAAGFSDNQIGLACPAPEKTGDRIDKAAEANKIDPVYAAETGAIAGAALGVLLGQAILVGVIPVIGPIVVGGALAAVLVSAAEVTAIGGVAGALIGLGVSEAEAHHLAGHLNTGKVIVTVQCEGREDEVAEILFRNGGHDRQNEMPDLPKKKG